jgi:trypsin
MAAIVAIAALVAAALVSARVLRIDLDKTVGRNADASDGIQALFVVPHLATRDKERFQFICAAAPISETEAVVPAHCILHFLREHVELDIVADRTDLCSGGDGTGTRIPVRIDEATLDYSWATGTHDIARLIVDGPVLRPLPVDAHAPAGAGSIVGWGARTFSGLPECERWSASADVLPDVACVERTDAVVNLQFDPAHDVCALAEPDPCRNSSGSPLIRDGRLVGILTWGVGCDRGYPVVFRSPSLS